MSLYITRSQLENRKQGNSLEIVNKHKNAGNNRETNLTHEEKALIGALGNIDKQKNVAEVMGVSQPTVSYTSRGVSSNGVKDEELIEDVKRSTKEMKEDIRDKTLTTLMSSLGIVEEKIGNAKTAAEASVVAKNLAIIHDKFNPSDNGGNRAGVNILIHVPQQKLEKDYEVIEA